MRFLPCLILALVPSLHAAGAPGNLLSNPGFEGDTGPDGMPAGGWSRNYGDANSKWVLQTGGAHSGQRCMRLEAPTIPEHNPSVSLEQTVPVTPGQRYRFRAWVRGEPKGAEGMLFIVWLAKDRGWISVSGASFTYGSDWEQRYVDGTAPDDAAWGVARMDIRRPGTAWVDDEFLAPLQAAVASIATNVRDGAITAGGGFRLEARPLDSDGVAIPGTDVTCDISSAGDAALLSPDPGGKSARHSVKMSDESGLAAFPVQASGRPGVTDKITLTAGNASLQIHVKSTANGRPASYAVTPERRTGLPGALIPVRVQLLGEYGEACPITGHKASISVGGVGSASPSAITTDRRGQATVRLRLPGDLYARVTVTVADEAGFTGQSAQIIVAPPVRADQVRLGSNGYFLHADGRPFVPFGGLYGNFVHTVENGVRGVTAPSSIADWSDEQLRQHFAYLRDNGVTAVRVMLRDHTKLGAEPMDAIGKVNLGLLRRWEHYMEVARPYGLRFLVTLHESWYATYASYFNADCMEKCVLPCYTPDELRTLPPYRRRFLVDKRMLVQPTDALSDPDVLACQRDYLTDLIPRLRANPDIFAYEIENEQPDGFFSWTEDQIRLIREFDPSTPICVSHLGAALLDADPLPWSRRTGIDFYTYHTYPSGDCTSKDMDYGVTVAVTARYSRLGKPAFSGESYGDQWYKAAPAVRRLGARDAIWAQLCAGTPGCFFWDTCDEPVKEFRIARQVMSRLDLAHFHRAKPRVGISVAHSLADDRFFQTPAGRAMHIAMGRIAQACFRRGVDFDFTFDNSSYATRLNVADADSVARLQPEVKVPEGYEAQYLLSENVAIFLCYLRNVAGSAQITSDPAEGWTRIRKPLPLNVTINLALKPRGMTLIDLDTGVASRVAIAPGRPLDLGTTDHDFLILSGTLQ